MTHPKNQYARLWRFMDGAFQANSGGHCEVRHLEEFTIEEMQRAERELEVLGMDPFELGAAADDGFTMWGQTHQEDAVGADDEQHKLMAWELLDRLY